MQFTVIVPDTADPKVIDAIAESIHQAGGTVEPAAQGPSPADAQVNPAGGQPGATPMPGDDPTVAAPGAGPLMAGPGAGMMPGQAMAAKGAYALRPR